MKIENAIKKLSKHGEVKNDGSTFYIIHGTTKIAAVANGGNTGTVACVYTQDINHPSESMIDYFTETWWPNLTQAIRSVIN